MAPHFATFVCCFLMCAGLAYGGYCFGYYDSHGKYVSGFSCPTSSDLDDETYCCGDTSGSTFKYCCDWDLYRIYEDINTWSVGYTVAIVFGVISVIMGIAAVVFRVLVVRRRAHAPTTIVTGTTCGVVNPVYPAPVAPPYSPSCDPPPAYPGENYPNAEPGKPYGINN